MAKLGGARRDTGMANEANGSEALLDDLEEFRPIGEIEDADRRRRKDLDRESARAVKGGATRGKHALLSALELSETY